MSYRSFLLGMAMLGINVISITAGQELSTISGGSMKAEIEVKFFIDKSDLENRLLKLNASLATPRRLMRRQMFAVPAALRKPNMEQSGRVRDEGNKITMTLKESTIPRTMSSVQELEIIVNDFDSAVKILLLSGYEPTTYQENYRTSWKLDDCSIEIDEWPGLPSYAEIEAPSTTKLKQMATILGIDETTFMCCSVFDLYQQKLGLNIQLMRKTPRLTFENIDQIKVEYRK